MAVLTVEEIKRMPKSEARARVWADRRLDWIRDRIDIGEASGNLDSSLLNPNQVFCINDWKPQQVVEKGRQEGHSFAFSLDSIARAVLEPKSQAIHISTDKWEAQKKQIYCMRILDSIKKEFKHEVKLSTESKFRLEFENGSIIDFLACRPPRGADRAGVYLDEIAFMPNFQQILKASLGCTTHGGYIRAGSTHCGTETEFYKMVRNTDDEYGNKPYKHWSRGTFPWWSCPVLCNDVSAALIEAPEMETRDRIEKYGNDLIKNVFYGYPVLADFQEEFECITVDSAHAFFPLELIQRCIIPEFLRDREFFEKADCYGNKVDALEPAKDVIRLLKRAIANGEVQGPLYIGMDVGRHVHTDEISIGNDYNGCVNLRLLITLHDVEFEHKEELYDFIVQELFTLERGNIDANGLGMSVAENLNKAHGQKAMPFDFTNPSKLKIAVDLKARMERLGFAMPQPFPQLIRQIHAIKKTVTVGGHIVFKVDENREHHGDKFWAIALMCACADAEGGVVSFPIEVINNGNPVYVPGEASDFNPAVMDSMFSEDAYKLIKQLHGHFPNVQAPPSGRIIKDQR